MYSPEGICNVLIKKHLQQPRRVLGLHKLVYFVHGWSLAYGYPLLQASPSVFSNGPIYKSLYHHMQSLRNDLVLAPLAAFESDAHRVESDPRAMEIIDLVVASYRHVSDMGLSALAHALDSPWKSVAHQYDYNVPSGTVIPNEEMKWQFGGLLARARMTAGLVALG